MFLNNEEVYDYLDTMPLEEKIARLSTNHWIELDEEEEEE